SRFVWEGVREPVQVVHRRATVPIAYHDWRDLSGEDRAIGGQDAALRRLLAGDRATGLPLTEPPLMRLAVARLADDRILLVWTAHHLVLDGWSLGQVFAEVCEQYAAIIGGRRPELPARRPFRDYLAWLRAQDQHEAERHWRQGLGGFGSPPPLADDRQPHQ